MSAFQDELALDVLGRHVMHFQLALQVRNCLLMPAHPHIAAWHVLPRCAKPSTALQMYQCVPQQ